MVGANQCKMLITEGSTGEMRNEQKAMRVDISDKEYRIQNSTAVYFDEELKFDPLLSHEVYTSCKYRRRKQLGIFEL